MTRDGFDPEEKKPPVLPAWFFPVLVAVLLAGSLVLLFMHYLSPSDSGSADPGPSATPSATPLTGADGSPAFLDVWFVDVGHGNCAILRCSDGKTLLVDAGNADDADKVLAVIEQAGIERFDLAFATTADRGHIGGLPAVLSRYPADLCLMTKECMASPEAAPLLSALDAQGIPVSETRASFTSVLRWSDLAELRIVSPYDAVYADEHDLSIMLHIAFGSTAVLLASDAQKPAERLAVKALPNSMLKAQVLLVGNHGDSDASSAKFLAAVKPKIAVISCGKNNMPADSVIRDLNRIGAEVLLTEEVGTVHITLDGVFAAVIK